jgi:hypothetical protein
MSAISSSAGARRNAFFLNGAHWLLLHGSDRDCQDAANEIDRLQAENAAFADASRICCHGDARQDG